MLFLLGLALFLHPRCFCLAYNYMCIYMNFLLQNQRTPLHIAVYRDNVLLVKKLISFGADINTKIVS